MHGTPNIRQLWIFRLTFFAFALIFASITFVNHYCFRTAGYDLGINNNAIYDYAHFRWNDCMIMQPQFTNVLSDHFSLIPILASPLYWILGTYTMLFVQWAGILFGGYGIYIYFKRKTDKTYMPVLAMVYFFSIWGIYSALAYDYHDNVMAAMFMPWFINYFDKQDWRRTILFFVLILITKENMALWMFFVSIGLVLLYWKNKKQVRISIILGCIALVYFAAMVGYIIPALSNADRDYRHFRYAALGQNFGEAITTIITRPVYAFELLYTNPTDDRYWDYVKPDLFKVLLFSGLIAIFIRPQYLIILLPIFAQKLYSNDIEKWGIYSQYSIEFVPILTFAVFDLVNRIKKPKVAYPVAGILIVLAAGITIHKMENKNDYWINANTFKFYYHGHYKQSFDIAEMHRALNTIPGDPTVKVSAQSFLTPHLAFRDYIYHYPYVMDADYVALAIDPDNTYPIMGQQAMLDTFAAYRNKPDWEVVYDKNSTLIARRKK